MNAVIYARYSSFGQREESIEGQIKACYEYAKENGYTVIREYIDRAASATNDHRAHFQEMIADSESGGFDTVIIYQMDRFSRNRYDSAIYKGRLRQNGVRVVSAKENISDDPSGVMLEGILETLAEYYSMDLALKIRRGQTTNAEKCLYNGGRVPLGYRIDETKHFAIDPDAAPIVKRVFEQYVNGASLADIVKELNEANVKTAMGTPFANNSLQKMLRNRRYLGIYIYGDVEVPGGMPSIIDQATFDMAQTRLSVYKHTPNARGDYLLTTKLYCGHCGEMMVGVSGTSKTGAAHHYYACKKHNVRKCDKRNVRRDAIEDAVLAECRNVLTDKGIETVAEKVSALCKAEAESPYLKQLRKELKQTENAIENLLKALESGQEADILLERVGQKRADKGTIEAQIAKEELATLRLSKSDVRFFLLEMRDGDIHDEKHRKILVNVLVNKIYLYDDKMTIYFNVGKKTVDINLAPPRKGASQREFLLGKSRSTIINSQILQQGSGFFIAYCFRSCLGSSHLQEFYIGAKHAFRTPGSI